MATAAKEMTANEAAAAMNNETKESSGIGSMIGGATKTIGIKLGAGACSVLNSFRNASDKYENYYSQKEKKGVFDYVVNAANSIGRGAASIVSTAGKTVSAVAGSKPVQAVKSGILNAYDTLREKYQSYLTTSSDQLAAKREEKAKTGEKTGFSLGFQTFLNSTAKIIDKVYSGGESLVKSATAGVKDVVKGVKGSDAYKNLTAAANVAEDEDEKSNDGPDV